MISIPRHSAIIPCHPAFTSLSLLQRVAALGDDEVGDAAREVGAVDIQVSEVAAHQLQLVGAVSALHRGFDDALNGRADLRQQAPRDHVGQLGVRLDLRVVWRAA